MKINKIALMVSSFVLATSAVTSALADAASPLPAPTAVSGFPLNSPNFGDLVTATGNLDQAFMNYFSSANTQLEQYLSSHYISTSDEANFVTANTSSLTNYTTTKNLPALITGYLSNSNPFYGKNGLSTAGQNVAWSLVKQYTGDPNATGTDFISAYLNNSNPFGDAASASTATTNIDKALGSEISGKEGTTLKTAIGQIVKQTSSYCAVIQPSNANALLTAIASGGSCANGGIIKLMPGTYTIQSIVSLPRSLTIQGSGSAVTHVVLNSFQVYPLQLQGNDQITGVDLVDADANAKSLVELGGSVVNTGKMIQFSQGDVVSFNDVTVNGAHVQANGDSELDNLQSVIYLPVGSVDPNVTFNNLDIYEVGTAHSSNKVNTSFIVADKQATGNFVFKNDYIGTAKLYLLTSGGNTYPQFTAGSMIINSIIPDENNPWQLATHIFNSCDLGAAGSAGTGCHQ